MNSTLETRNPELISGRERTQRTQSLLPLRIGWGEGSRVRCVFHFALLVSALFLLHSAFSASAATVSWIGASGDWNTPANWTNSMLPGPDDDVVIDRPGDITITHSSGTHSVKSLQSQENFVLSGGSLSFSNASQFSTSLTLSGGTLAGSGDVTVTGMFDWSNGTMSGSGRTIIAATGGLNLGGANTRILSRVLQNDGAANWTGSGLLLMAGGTFNNNGSFTINSASPLSSYGNGPGVNAFNNAGTFTKQGAGTASFTINANGNVPFNNNGTVDVQAGTLTCTAGGSNSGSITANAGGTMLFNASYTHAPGSSLNGAGTVTISSGTHTFPIGTFTPTGTVNFSGGTITINNTFTPAGLGPINSATVNFNAAETFGSLTLSGGTLAGSGDVTVTGMFDWSNGTMSGSGRTIIAATGGLNLGGANTRILSRVLQNDGAANWTGSGLLLMAGGTFNNNGSFTINSASPLSSYGNGPGVNAFNNAGTFTKQGAGTASFTINANGNVPFNNSGTVDVQGGTIALNAGGSNSGTLSAGAAGTLTLTASYTHGVGSSLSGSGTVTINGGTHTFPAGTFTPTGTVNFASGTITVNNTFAPTSLGTIGATVTFNNAVNYTGAVNIATTASFAAAQSFSGLTLSGTLSGSGDVTVTGTLNWTGGTMSGSGRTIIANTGTLSLNTSTHQLNRVLQNDGTATWTGGPLQMNGGTFNNNGSFTANSAGTLDSSGSGGTNVFNNAGTFTKLGAGEARFRVNTTGVAFNNSGNVSVTAGTVQLTSGDISFPGGSVLHIAPGSTLRTSSSSITGTASDPAQWSPQGRLLFHGVGAGSLEVMGRDLGDVPAGYTNNFGFGTIELTNNVSVVLTDTSDNGPGAEALYVDNLIVRPGCTLYLNGLHVYARISQISGRIAGDLAYPAGFIWQRFLDYRAGTVSGATNGNPLLDPFGSPVWQYSWVDQNQATAQTPWFALTPAKMVWSSSWFGRPELARWQRGNDVSPIVDLNYLTQGNVFNSQQQYAPVVKWSNPLGRDVAVSVTGPGQAIWGFAPTPGRIEVVISKRSGITGLVMPLFQQEFAKPTANTTSESVSFQVSLPYVNLSPVDEILFAMRKVNALGFNENTLFDDSQIQIRLLTPAFWTGLGDAVSWSDALNWTSNAVPGSQDDVIISETNNPAITVTGAHSVHSLFTDESVNLAPGSSLMLARDAIANSPVTNSGAIQDGDWTFNNDLTVNGSGILNLGSSKTVSLRASLLGNTVGSPFSIQGTLRFDGSGTPASPQRLEVMGADLGNVAAGFNQNFACGKLNVANKTLVQLVDFSDNSSGTNAEAIYVNSVIVSAGATLDLNGLNLYARSSQIVGTVTNGSIILFADGGPIRLGTVTPGSISSAGQIDDWTFFGRNGETVTIAVDTGSSSVFTPQLSYAEVRLLGVSSNLLMRSSNSIARQTVTLANAPLLADGIYRVQVRAPINQPSSSGNYLVAVWEVTPDVAPLVLNQTMNGRIETPYSVDRWTFSAMAGQQVRFDLINASAPGVNFSLRGPGGVVLFTNLVNDSGLVNLPADGGYTLTAFGTGGNYDIAYAFKLNQTLLTDLPLGTNFTGQFTGSGQPQLFRITLTNSGPLRISLANGDAGNRAEIYVARDGPPTRGSFDFSSADGPGANREILIPSASAGTFYVLVYGDYIPAPGAFTIQVTSAGVYLTSITPNRHANNVGFAMTLTGAGFESGTTVELLAGGGVTAVTATNVSVDSYSQITAFFPPTLVSTGLYSVRIQQPDNDSATFTNGFEMLAPGHPNFNSKLIIPSALGRHGLATLYIEYENAGNASMAAPLIQLRSSDNDGSDRPLLTLSQQRLSGGFWTRVLPEGFGHSVTILASGQQAGLLHPGEKMRVPVYYAGLLQPWDFSDTKVELGLSVIETGDGNPMNWEGITYASANFTCLGTNKLIGSSFTETKSFFWIDGYPPTGQQLLDGLRPPSWPGCVHGLIRWDEPGVLQLRPASISELAWTGIVTNLRASVGANLGDWVRTLSENAQYLARHGQPNANIDDLWRFEVLQASGLGPVPVLDAVTDASMVTPGVGLSLSRAFPNSIPARHVLGPFGYGWTFSWNLKLTEDTNGLVQIGSCCGGSQRRYEPDTRTPGKYFSMPGDTSSLRKLGNGTFELRDTSGTVTRFAVGGLLDAIEDPNGNRVTASYDGSSRLQMLTHTSGASLAIGYTPAGRIAEVRDSAGRTNRFTYDGSGNYLITATTHDGKVTRYTYQTSGDARTLHALTSIERGGTTQHFTYDPRGRLESTHRAGNEQLIRFSYDSAGTVFVADQLGTNQLFYNESGLLTKVVDPLGHITSSEFDSDFRLKRLVLPTGENQSFAWTKTGNLTSLTDELGHSTSFTYDQNFNRLASFTDARANTTRYTYDARGNLLSTIFPNQSVERFANYTGAGLPLTYTNRRGQPLIYEYNATGQITNQVFTNGHSIQFTYDARGNLASTIDGTKVTIYAYAPANDGDRLKRVTYPNGRFLDYTYDSFGRRIQMTDQDGFATKYEYDSAGRLWKLRDEANTLLVTYAYDPSGRLNRIDKGNGTFTTYEYDAAGQLLSLKNHRNAATLNSRFDYTYDRRGRRTTMSTLDGDWTYGYDAIGQLTRADFDSTNPQIPDQDLTYEYDALGNRVRTIENGVTNSYVANNLNQYTSVAGTNHQYDADGNLTFDGVNTYEWDQQSRLVRVTGPSGVTEYEYDAFGNRRATIQNGQRADYLLDPYGLVDVIIEHDVSGNLIARNVHGLGLASRRFSTGTGYYYEFDGIGSTAGVTGSSGTNSNRYVYEPFGGNLLSNGTVANPFQFVGQFGIEAQESGLNFVRARHYDSRTGRFLSNDPLGFHQGGGLNTYRYGLNAPTSFIDVSGKNAGIIIYGFIDLYSEWAQHKESLKESEEFLRKGKERNDDKIYNSQEPYSCYRARNSTAQCFNKPLPKIEYPLILWTKEQIEEIRNAVDPNEKVGPMGFGTANFLAPGASLPYRIKFENFGPGSVDGNGASFPSQVWASAPAQEVEITDALSPALDWSTLRFTGFGFGDTLRALEPPRSFFQTILPVTINGKSFEVHFEASLDLATGRLRAVFRSIDPQTSLPPEVLTGFLPPEDGTGRGQGFIEYTIEPRAGLPTGTQIRNVALISFDRQPTIATDQIDPLNPAAGNDPAKQALVTIDSGAPSSSVTALPAESGRAFIVQWSGADDALGSGLASYDVFVSTNGTMFVPWFSNITATSSLFIGELGKSYAFYSIARDNVGNVELPPVAPDAHTLVITNAPLIVGLTNQIADVGAGLVISNTVAGASATNFLWSLVSAPFGASIGASNGVLRWTPACSQGSTTNTIAIWATDRARPNISDLMVFTVAVKECVAPTLGRLVLRTGDTGRLPINLITSVPLTNLITLVSLPTNRFINLGVEALATQICFATITATNAFPLPGGEGQGEGELYQITLTTCTNHSLIGTQQVAWLVLTAVTNQHSAFVPVEIGPSIGTQPDGTFVTNYVTQAGRVVIVGEEPLLEVLRSTNGLVQAVLYAPVGSTNVVQTSPDLPALSWSAWQPVTMTNLLQSLPLLPATNRTLFFRAVRQ